MAPFFCSSISYTFCPENLCAIWFGSLPGFSAYYSLRLERCCNYVSRVRLLLSLGRERNVAAGQAQFPQLVLKRLPVHPQNGGRPRDVASGVFQAARDVAPLEFPPVLFGLAI